jgi:MFS family permease
MLGSITPLGERGRGTSWGLTVGAYLIGSASAGVVLGGLLGWLGDRVLPMSGLSGRGGLAALAGLVALGAAVDARLVGRGLPSARRQVNEVWLRRYRGWVYGVGFGFQLGLGVVTIVSISAVYMAFFAAFISGSAIAGAVIGGGFGLLRATPILATARVHRPEQLAVVNGALRRWDGPARRLAVVVEAGVAAVALLATVG